MTWSAPWMQSRPSNQLGAIVGRKRLEFRVPSRVFDDLTLGRAQAVCIGYTSGIDELIQAGFDARNYDFLPKDIENLRTRIYAEEKKMRSKGVQGRIPVCVFRKDWQGRLNKYQRRAEATHERFHADYRRRESERGLDDGDTCVIGNIGAELVYHMGDEGRNAYGAGELLGWAGNNLSVLPEEVLARTEEAGAGWRAYPMKKLPDSAEAMLGVIEIDGAGKGWLAVMLALLFAPGYGLAEGTVAAVAFAVFIGHLFPLYFAFKGGKGVATALGILLAINAWLGLATLATWVIIAVFFRISSLAAIIAAVFAPLCTFWWFGLSPYTAAVLGVSLLLVWRHEANLRKLLAGQESRIGQKQKAGDPR